MKKMKMNELKKILDNHEHWILRDVPGWETLRADLSGANLSRANLSRADLSGADLSGADLSRADLSGAKLSWADLSRADLSGAKLSGADLSGADLSGADLSGAKLSEAKLSWADLSEADLSEAKLSEAKLSEAKLSGAKLSGAKGLLDPVAFIRENFARKEEGYIVYKCFHGSYPVPEYWTIEPGAIIEEVANPDRTTECGCGINVAPKEWVIKSYPEKVEIWECLIRWEWLPGVIVPLNTDGKIRCSKLELIRMINRE